MPKVEPAAPEEVPMSLPDDMGMHFLAEMAKMADRVSPVAATEEEDIAVQDVTECSFEVPSRRVKIGARTPGTQFNRNIFGLSFGLKNRLRFHFDSETCLNYSFMNIFFYRN